MSKSAAFKFSCSLRVSLGLLDTIGIFTVEEIAGTFEDKFIAVDFDFATVLSSFFVPASSLTSFWRS